jgi:hypothetical protein
VESPSKIELTVNQKEFISSKIEARENKIKSSRRVFGIFVSAMGFVVKFFVVLLLVLACIYLSVLVVAFQCKENFTFLPAKDFLYSPFEGITQEVWVSAPREPSLKTGSTDLVTPQVKLHGWFVPAPASQFEHVQADAVEKKTVLFAHGNGGNVSYYTNIVTFFHGLGCDTMLFDYPGFGQSGGKPSEKGCYDAGKSFYDELVHGPRKVKPQNIVLCGMSLGGAIAARLAATETCHSLILLSTFTSPRALVCSLFSPLFLWSYVANEFFLNDDLKKLAERDPTFAKTRALVLHSRQDKLIGMSQPEQNAKTLGCGAVVEIGGWHGMPFFPNPARERVAHLLQAS